MSSDTLLWMVMTLAFRRYLCDGIYPTMLIGFVNKIGQLFFAENKTPPIWEGVGLAMLRER